MKIKSSLLRTMWFCALSQTIIEGYSQVHPQTNHPFKSVFKDILVIDNQTVFVPSKKTFELELQQRFGVVNHGASDLFGLYAPSNTRIGAYYVPCKNLLVGVGLTKEEMQLGIEAKYNFFQQGRMPFSLTYLINGSAKMEEDKEMESYRDRLSFFHQIMIARQVEKRLSLQLAPSISHFNKISRHSEQSEYFDTTKFNHVAISLVSQYRFNSSFSLIAEFDEPLTKHKHRKPLPNISFGFQITRGSYGLQVFAENFYSIDAQSSNMFNRNNFREGQFLLGFNLSKSFHGGNARNPLHE